MAAEQQVMQTFMTHGSQHVPPHTDNRSEAVMDALILVQEGSNRVTREALMLGPDRYEPCQLNRLRY